MKLTITIPEKVSLNKIYAGIHFRERSRHKDEYHYAVLSAKPKTYTGSFPTHFSFHFRLSGTPLDIDNHVYMCKMTTDSLVDAGVIPADDQKYISGMTITSEKVSKNEPNEVDVTITPCA